MDPLEARDLFPVVRRHIYLNHAGVGPLSERLRAAIEQVLEMMATGTYSFDWMVEEAQQAHHLAERLLGAEPGTVAFSRSTSHGLSLLAGGLDWRPGDNVVGARGEFPSNVYPWLALGERGVEVRLVEPEAGRVTAERVLDLMDDRTRVVALSHVQFWNGYRLDLAAIGRECRARGVILCVDAMQSAGALEVDVDRLGIDFLSAGASKWLLCPTGIGLVYVRREVQQQVRPVLVGTHTVKAGHDFFNYDYDPLDTALRYEESSSSLIGTTSLVASLSLLLEIGISVIEARVLDLARRAAEGLAALDFEIVEPWPRTAAESSGIVSFRKPGASAQEVLRDLTAHGIVARVHADFVRLSPHFYNTEAEVDRVLDVLAPERVET